MRRQNLQCAICCQPLRCATSHSVFSFKENLIPATIKKNTLIQEVYKNYSKTPVNNINIDVKEDLTSNNNIVSEPASHYKSSFASVKNRIVKSTQQSQKQDLIMQQFRQILPPPNQRPAYNRNGQRQKLELCARLKRKRLPKRSAARPRPERCREIRPLPQNVGMFSQLDDDANKIKRSPGQNSDDGFIEMSSQSIPLSPIDFNDLPKQTVSLSYSGVGSWWVPQEEVAFDTWDPGLSDATTESVFTEYYSPDKAVDHLDPLILPVSEDQEESLVGGVNEVSRHDMVQEAESLEVLEEGTYFSFVDSLEMDSKPDVLFNKLELMQLIIVLPGSRHNRI